MPADEIAWDAGGGAEECAAAGDAAGGAAGGDAAGSARRVTLALPRDAVIARLEELVRGAVDARSEAVDGACADEAAGGGAGAPRADGAAADAAGAAGGGGGAWAAEAAAAVAEAAGGVARARVVRADARCAELDVETREGEAFCVLLGPDGAAARDGRGGADSLHALLLARSAAYAQWFAGEVAARLAPRA